MYSDIKQRFILLYIIYIFEKLELDTCVHDVTIFHLSSADLCADRVTIKFIESWVDSRYECVAKRGHHSVMAEQQSVIRKSSQTLVQAGGQIRAANPEHNTTAEQNTRSCWHTEGAPAAPECVGGSVWCSVWPSFFKFLSTFPCLEDWEEVIKKSKIVFYIVI